MSQYQGAFQLTREAGEDLSSKQFYFVEQQTDGDFIAGTGPTAKIQGIVQNAPTSGKAARVALLGAGTSKLVVKTSVEGNIVIGNKLTSTSDGRGENCDAGTDEAFVTALEAASADGTVIEVRLDAAGGYV